MPVSNSSAFVLNHDAGSLQHLCLFESSHASRLFVYLFKAVLGKRQVSFFPIRHPQSMVKRITTKILNVYYQL